MSPPRRNSSREERRPASNRARGSASRPRSTRAGGKAKPPFPINEPPPLLKRLGVQPRKSLGQHYLIDELVLGDIADACGLDGTSTVLEIGAGPGGLTEELVQRAGHVVAVEIDEELVAATRRRLGEHGNLCLLAADVLDFEPAELLAECDAVPPFVACGNLPYYITQPVVRRLVEADPGPERIVVMVQREVARRMVGGPGDESLLSMGIRWYGQAEALFDVPPESFWPAPKVHSTVIRVDRAESRPLEIPAGTSRRLFALLRAGFSEPRRQLHNALANALGMPDREAVDLLNAAGIDAERRARHLDFPDWGRLFAVVERRHPRALDVE